MNPSPNKSEQAEFEALRDSLSPNRDRSYNFRSLGDELSGHDNMVVTFGVKAGVEAPDPGATLTNDDLSEFKREWAKSIGAIKPLLKPVGVPSDRVSFCFWTDTNDEKNIAHFVSFVSGLSCYIG